MELLINIDEDVRIAITRVGLLRISDEMQKKVDKAIQRGTPLPKGHGRLKDVDKIEALLDLDKADNEIAKALKNIMEHVPTIIEEDVESEDRE